MNSAKNAGTSTAKDSILAEIFVAYKEAGIAYKKTVNPEIRHKLLAMKHCFDLALKSLLPLNDDCLKSLEEVNAPFAN
jgi:hypothetical protein